MVANPGATLLSAARLKIQPSMTRHPTLTVVALAVCEKMLSEEIARGLN
jgi:hypothetical protein